MATMLPRTNLNEQVYETLRQRVLRRDPGPGAKLSLHELATELGVSRSPVHHALTRLVSEGPALGEGAPRVLRDAGDGEDGGRRVKPLYRAVDAPPLEPEPPGVFPFTRGPYPDMYRGRPWTIRQYAGFASAEESNERYRYLLARRQTGLSIAFDLPTQLGYDSDDPVAAGEVGAPASRSTRSRTWSCCSAGSRSTGCRRR